MDTAYHGVRRDPFEEVVFPFDFVDHPLLENVILRILHASGAESATAFNATRLRPLLLAVPGYDLSKTK